MTFDNYGVSGHKNHISIYRGLKRLVDQRSLSHTISVYTLDSVTLLRKYIFVLDLVWSFLTRKLIFVSGLSHVSKCQVMLDFSHHYTLSETSWRRVVYGDPPFQEGAPSLRRCGQGGTCPPNSDSPQIWDPPTQSSKNI